MDKNNTKIAPGEMEILEILWENGELTLSEAHEVFLRKGRQIAYSTVQTRLERMVNKGLLARSEGRGGAYRAVAERESISAPFFDWIEELCRGNLTPLILHLAGKRRFRPDELAAMRELLQRDETDDVTDDVTDNDRSTPKQLDDKQ